MIRLVYTRRADADIRAVWRHVAAENESAADRILIALMDRIESLRRHPRFGPRRPDIRPAARVLVEGHHLVLYELHPDTDDGPVDWIEVVGIVDGRRDLASLF